MAGAVARIAKNGDSLIMLKLENVSYSYAFQERAALKNISIDLKRGEAILVTGPSGCGKSTLLKIISGLIPTHFILAEKSVLMVWICRRNSEISQSVPEPDDQFMTMLPMKLRYLSGNIR